MTDDLTTAAFRAAEAIEAGAACNQPDLVALATEYRRLHTADEAMRARQRERGRKGGRRSTPAKTRASQATAARLREARAAATSQEG